MIQRLSALSLLLTLSIRQPTPPPPRSIADCPRDTTPTINAPIVGGWESGRVLVVTCEAKGVQGDNNHS